MRFRPLEEFINFVMEAITAIATFISIELGHWL
jgi:hypothetical protein